MVVVMEATAVVLDMEVDTEVVEVMEEGVTKGAINTEEEE